MSKIKEIYYFFVYIIYKYLSKKYNIKSAEYRRKFIIYERKYRTHRSMRTLKDKKKC